MISKTNTETLDIVNPATGKLIETVAMDNAKSVGTLCQQLRGGTTAWAARPLEERCNILKAFSTLLQHNKEQLATTLTEEMGKPVTQARAEIEGAQSRIDYFIRIAAKTLDETTVSDADDIQEILTYQALGTVASISAWNYPYLVGVNVFIPALITGNTVLYKPSEYASLTGMHICNLLHKAGVPDDAFGIAIGDASVGELILKQDLNGFFFTGSVTTGRHVAKTVAEKLVPVGLELGGKDSLYVTDEIDDVNDVALAAVEGAFYNNGQSCCAVERIYVHENVYDAFCDAFIMATDNLHVGDPMNDSTDQGPLTRPQHVKFLEEHLADAKQKGATIHQSRRPIPQIGNYFPPTVLTNVNHTMRAMKEESFGPIIGIMKTQNDEEATKLMNDSQYGLTAAVYSNNNKRAKKILEQLEVGTAYQNLCDRVSPQLPWSGQKQSGLGATLSHLGILAFVKPKAYHLRTC